ncbi:hypothetical protein PAV_4c00510 [Paenibacillus alvei DSM 29]|uniref:hypothetical protein n=1 Tax=Paenibacillus alvei TaxID=44250 RepID=UPI00028A32B6|nr:hypothetical protein [Paenibacillus alvei]EJW16973.1 hypothetical protein PAV_4c00510 [Paenibacillus alvei DSM 29]
MPVMIQITGENAGQAIEEFAALSTAFTGAVNTVTAAAPVQEEKPKRQRTTKTEPKPESTKETESVEKRKTSRLLRLLVRALVRIYRPLKICVP